MSSNCQRWAEGHPSWRPPEERIRPADYEVAPIEEEIARRFVEQHHYSGTYPAARQRVGLFRRGALEGVAVFSHPCNDAALTNVFAGLPALDAIELGRFVLLDAVPGMGETWFLARCFEQLRAAGLRGVLSFSDPIGRTTADGRLIFPGHLGTIYQAHNGRFLGRGTRRALRLLPDGRSFSARAWEKIRSGSRGWRYASAQLEAFGAEALDPAADRPARMAWLARWLPQLTRPLKHPGNFRYAWPLDRRVRIALPAQPYPKVRAA